MVCRATVWPRSQEAHERDLSHTRATHGFDEVASAFNMHSLKRLAADFAVDSRAMRHGIASSKSLRERCRIRESRLHKLSSRKMNGIWIAPVHPSRQQNQLVTLRRQLPRQVPANKARCSGDCDLHHASLRFQRRRRAIWVGQTALRKSPNVWAICSGSRRYKMRFPSRRSDIKSAFFRIERCREIDGPEMVKHAVISPAESSPRLSSCRIWRRVGSAKARNALEMDFINNNIAIWLNSVKSKNGNHSTGEHYRAEGGALRAISGTYSSTEPFSKR